MKKIDDELNLAIDGGTTNTRARLLRGDLSVAVASRPVGVRDVAISGSNERLVRAVAECVDEVVEHAGVTSDAIGLAAASGMITSNVGLHEVSHVLAPAGIDDLARHVATRRFPEIHDLAIHFVPGIKTLPTANESELHGFDALSQTDVMRGEESETFGILGAAELGGPIVLLLPGSHTKLVHVDAGGRITGSFTTIAGELMQAVAERTILASSIDWPPTGEPQWPAVEAGARFVRAHGLARGGFAVRMSDVVAGIDRSARAWFFVGLVVGNDWMELGRWQPAAASVRLLVGGREPLRSTYAHLAKFSGRDNVEPLDDAVVESATARGAISIARRSTVLRVI